MLYSYTKRFLAVKAAWPGIRLLPKRFRTLDAPAAFLDESDPVQKIFEFKKNWMNCLVNDIYDMKLHDETRVVTTMEFSALDEKDYLDDFWSQAPRAWVIDFGHQMCELLNAHGMKAQIQVSGRQTMLEPLSIKLSVSEVPRYLDRQPLRDISCQNTKVLCELLQNKLLYAFREVEDVIDRDYFYCATHEDVMHPLIQATICPAAKARFLKDYTFHEPAMLSILHTRKHPHRLGPIDARDWRNKDTVALPRINPSNLVKLK